MTSTLPGPKTDPYAGVDSGNFDTAANLTTAQMLEMADLAARRGEQANALRWKTEAVDSARRDETREQSKRMTDLMTPNAMPPPGQVMDAPAALPWHGDTEYRELTDRVARARDAVTAAENDSDYETVNAAQAELTSATDAMYAREQTIKDSLRASGAWTEQDERTLAAQQSLSEKAVAVAQQFKG